jgi:hypothetical protein
MHKFIFKLLRFAAVQGVLLTVLLTPYFLNYKLAVEDGFMAGTIDKHRLLKQQESPRLIFIGGSSFAFGNNSGYIAQKLGDQYHPINMGINAGLGVQYMLNEVKDDLKPGDVVVVSMEYEDFIDFPPGPKEVTDVLEARWQNFQYLPLNYVPALLDKGLISGGGILRRSLQTLTGNMERESYYKRSSFNEFGDVVAHYSLANLTDKVTQEGKTYKFQPELVQRTIQYMNDFNADAKAKGAKVFFAYPPLMKRLLLKSLPEIQTIETALAISLDFPIIDRPEDVGYPDSYYFDTRYHLNKIGTDARSQHLAEKLVQELSKQ